MLPTRLSKTEIYDALSSLHDKDISWRDGKAWAYVYDPGKETEIVGKTAYVDFLSENALDFTAFPSVLKMEQEIVAIMANHASGDEDTVGNFTSGGTESIILAVKAARDKYSTGGWIPEIILPATGHASFWKAAHLLGCRVVPVPVDSVSFKAIPEEVEKAITANTIMIVGSAVSYAHGVLDPIAALASIAAENDIWMHVDACIGGFVLPFFKRFGGTEEAWDFAVPGVSSISIDLHKYAFCPKGASVLLFKDRELRRHELYACASWTGYGVVNSTLQSSKSGGPVAASWAVLHHLGDEGYEKLFLSCWDSTKKLVEGIQKISGLEIMGEPDSNLIAFSSTEEGNINIFEVADLLNEKGWFVQVQLRFENSKENIHLSVNPKAEGWVESFLQDLGKAVQEAAQSFDLPFLGVSPEELEEMDFSGEMFDSLLGMVGVSGTSISKQMAPINGLLNVLPPSLREKILIEFVNRF